MEAGQVIPVIDRQYELSDAVEAFRYFGTGEVKGKLIVRMKS
ncbi:zinc-binding dehydrogenase [Paenibacillus lupini]